MEWTILIAVVIVGIMVSASSGNGLSENALRELYEKIDELNEKLDAVHEKLDDIEDRMNGKRYVNPIELR